MVVPTVNALVTLSVKPGSDSTFGGWSGACAGTQSTCTVTINGQVNVGATFALVPRSGGGGGLRRTGGRRVVELGYGRGGDDRGHAGSAGGAGHYTVRIVSPRFTGTGSTGW